MSEKTKKSAISFIAQSEKLGINAKRILRKEKEALMYMYRTRTRRALLLKNFLKNFAVKISNVKYTENATFVWILTKNVGTERYIGTLTSNGCNISIPDIGKGRTQ